MTLHQWIDYLLDQLDRWLFGEAGRLPVLA